MALYSQGKTPCNFLIVTILQNLSSAFYPHFTDSKLKKGLTLGHMFQSLLYYCRTIITGRSDDKVPTFANLALYNSNVAWFILQYLSQMGARGCCVMAGTTKHRCQVWAVFLLSLLQHNPDTQAYVGPSLVFYHRPMAGWWWKHFQLRLQCKGRKTSSLRAAPEQSCCWPAEVSWMPLPAPYRSVELKSAPWKHTTCAGGALQFGLTLCLSADKHSPVPVTTCRCTGKDSQWL